jgi:hypothetical protein
MAPVIGRAVPATTTMIWTSDSSTFTVVSDAGRHRIIRTDAKFEAPHWA